MILSAHISLSCTSQWNGLAWWTRRGNTSCEIRRLLIILLVFFSERPDSSLLRLLHNVINTFFFFDNKVINFCAWNWRTATLYIERAASCQPPFYLYITKSMIILSHGFFFLLLIFLFFYISTLHKILLTSLPRARRLVLRSRTRRIFA